MKAKALSSGSGGDEMHGGGGSVAERVAVRSASEKEKTKMRERQRRAITTKIFNGLRKHGGYNLPPRSDINDVLRQLAREAGWFIEPDGTTYRIPNHHRQNISAGSGNPHFNTTTTTTTISTPTTSSLNQQYYYYCTSSGTPTPTSSFGGASGECSTTASPHHHHHSTPAPLLPPPPAPPLPAGSLNNQTPDNQIFSATTTNEDSDNPISLYFGMPGYYSNNCDMGINGEQTIGATTNTAEISSLVMQQPLSNLQQLYYFQE
ncbi:hypothetical protein MKW94_024685 [Papaver nudicaule]|uniref:Protein BZR1 homolog n=1 Tax=Papaver nudicaule TaxID=74823 RepID=A0AA41RX93_PAPNU|nr:hypothetical protein [Papaver nudicaule]